MADQAQHTSNFSEANKGKGKAQDNNEDVSMGEDEEEEDEDDEEEDVSLLINASLATIPCALTIINDL